MQDGTEKILNELAVKVWNSFRSANDPVPVSSKDGNGHSDSITDDKSLQQLGDYWFAKQICFMETDSREVKVKWGDTETCICDTFRQPGAVPLTKYTQIMKRVTLW
jgi:hypothetical protein